MLAAFDDADAISGNSKWFYGLIQTNIWVIIIEVFVILVHFNETLPHKHYTIAMAARRLLTGILYAFCLINLFSIRGWDSHGVIHALSSK